MSSLGKGWYRLGSDWLKLYSSPVFSKPGLKLLNELRKGNQSIMFIYQISSWSVEIQADTQKGG